MTEAQILTMIGQSWAGQTMHKVTWLFSVFETVHFIGLCFLMGAMLLVDLRLLGLMRQVPLKAVLWLLPVAIAGFLANLVSGLGFFASSPEAYWFNPAFKLKMALVVLAGLNALYFEFAERKPILAATDQHADTHLATKISGALSLLLWLLIIFWGRAIPTFNGSTSLFG